MKTICTLDGKIIMSQDGEALETMELNSAIYEGSKASVVTDDVYEAMIAAQPLPKRLINAPILAQLALLDEQRVRPMAEITLAQVSGEPIPLYAKAKLADIEKQADELRGKLVK